ncbi:MAG: hypothetical protein R3F07_00795 [Opitutaceae bacterium]
MAGGESERHRDLKQRAAGWAERAGFAILGEEVRLPGSPFRADLAACRRPRSGSADPGESAVFECKQARPDLRKDANAEAATRQRLSNLLSRQRRLESLLARHLPNLRHGETLFPEYDSLDLDGFQHGPIHKVRREAEALSRRLYGGTKFDRIVRYRSADFCYLVLTEELAAGYAPPQGWGLLVVEGDGLRLERRPIHLEAGPVRRLALLVSIARKAARGVRN